MAWHCCVIWPPSPPPPTGWQAMTGRSVCRFVGTSRSVWPALGAGAGSLVKVCQCWRGPSSHILLGLHPTFICNQGRNRGVGGLNASKENWREEKKEALPAKGIKDRRSLPAKGIEEKRLLPAKRIEEKKTEVIASKENWREENRGHC